MSIKSILSEVGHGLEVFFTDATKVAQLAEPIVDIALPGIASLYNLTVTAAVNAENAAIAAGKQSGTGTQKLALVTASIYNDFAAYAKAAGISYNQTTITNWINAVVATLNSIPASSTTTPAGLAAVSNQLSQGNVTISIPSTAVSASATSGTLL